MWWMAGMALGAANSIMSGKANKKAAREYNKKLREAEVLNMVYRNRGIMDNLTYQQEQAALKKTEINEQKQKSASNVFMSNMNRGIDTTSTSAQRLQQVAEFQMSKQENLLQKQLEKQRRSAQIQAKQSYEQALNNIKNGQRSTKGANVFDVMGGAASGAISGNQFGNAIEG